MDSYLRGLQRQANLGDEQAKMRLAAMEERLDLAPRIKEEDMNILPIAFYLNICDGASYRHPCDYGYCDHDGDCDTVPESRCVGCLACQASSIYGGEEYQTLLYGHHYVRPCDGTNCDYRWCRIKHRVYRAIENLRWHYAIFGKEF